MNSSGRGLARLTAVHGLALAAAFTAVVTATLIWNPLIWIQDYPPDVRAAAGDLAAPTVQRAIAGAALFAVIVGGLVASNLRVRRLDAAPGFGRHFLHTFGLLWIVNLADIVIVDWLLFMNVLRGRAVLPGTEGLAGYDDYLFHVEQSVLTPAPWIGSIVLSALVAAGVVFVFRHRPDARP